MEVETKVDRSAKRIILHTDFLVIESESGCNGQPFDEQIVESGLMIKCTTKGWGIEGYPTLNVGLCTVIPMVGAPGLAETSSKAELALFSMTDFTPSSLNRTGPVVCSH